jgi:hypothetical protein
LAAIELTTLVKQLVGYHVVQDRSGQILGIWIELTATTGRPKERNQKTGKKRTYQLKLKQKVHFGSK